MWERSRKSPLIQAPNCAKCSEDLHGTARKTGSAESLLEKIGQAERQRKEIEHELIVLELQQGELEKQVLNAEVMQDSLIRFRDLFDLATDEEKKYLFQLMIGRIIWTPEEIKMALYDRPTDTGRLSKPQDVNQNSDVSLEVANWLPGPDSN